MTKLSYLFVVRYKDKELLHIIVKGGGAMSEYTDLKGNIHEITNTVLTSDDKERIENEIVEQLYEIFTRK